MKKKTVHVVAAVIKHNNTVLATARGYGEYKGMWEFPGGKIELGETPKDALRREIMEELCIEIHVCDFIKCIEYDYPAFHLSMQCYFAEVASGNIMPTEAEDWAWLDKQKLYSVNWLPADTLILNDVAMALGEDNSI